MFNVTKKVLNIVSLDLGIDLGTANTLVYLPNKVIINEPSIVAINKETGEVLKGGNAVGNEAKRMVGKVPKNIQTIRPLKHGVIDDFGVAEAMLRYFIRKARGVKWGVRVRVVIAIPSGINSVQKQAVIDSTKRAGAKEVYLIDEPMAAAIGAGLPITDPEGSMIVDIGGGTSETAILSLAGAVTTKSITVAGDAMDQAIVEYMREHKQILIEETTAEAIKKELGSAYELEEELEVEVRGQHSKTSLPTTVTVNSIEIREAIKETVNQIVLVVKNTLKEASPGISADLLERGIVLAGGGALLKGLDQLISKETNLPVRISDSPLECVVRGTAIVLNKLDYLRHILTS